MKPGGCAALVGCISCGTFVLAGWSLIVVDSAANGLHVAVHCAHAPCTLRVFVQGAREHLQAGFVRYMRAQVNRNRSAAQRGADPDPLRDVQVYP